MLLYPFATMSTSVVYIIYNIYMYKYMYEYIYMEVNNGKESDSMEKNWKPK